MNFVEQIGDQFKTDIGEGVLANGNSTKVRATNQSKFSAEKSHCLFKMPYLYAVIGVPVVFVLGFGGSIIPPVSQRLRKGWDVTDTQVFRFLNGFAAGVIIAVGFVHSFPEGDAAISENWAVEYPFAGLFALLGALITFTVESVVSRLLFSLGSPHSHGIDVITEDEYDNGKDIEMKERKHEIEELGITEEELRQQKIRFYTEMYVLLFGLSFHSIFVGFALGLSNDDLGLFLAILCHQTFEGIALGVRITRAKISKNIFVLFIDFLFSIATPVGIVIGLWIKSSVIENPQNYEIIQGSFNAFSAGILLYVGLVHMLAEEVNRETVVKSLPKYLAIYIGVLLGAAMMSVLAIWA